MTMLVGYAQQFFEQLANACSLDGLSSLLEKMTYEMGFRHFALVHHVDFLENPKNAIGLHNYPDHWVERFVANRLYEYDPIMRASEKAGMAFAWANVPRLLDITDRDRDLLHSARKEGVADGLTVPFRIPGEPHGSCSFATPLKNEGRYTKLLLAQLVGTLAFEAARKLIGTKATNEEPVKLTDRQRECLVLASKGKTDWEIARILGIGEETARLHLKMARERFGVNKRLPLAIKALYEGQITFSEVLDYE